MENRRAFLMKLGAIGASLPLSVYIEEDSEWSDNKNEINWKQVRKSFPIKKYPFIHLNSGSAGVMPKSVENTVIGLMKEMNRQPPYEVWDNWKFIKQSNLNRLANHLHVAASELAVFRNATEALNNIIQGLSLEKGDEIILASHDYPFVLYAFQQRVEREGIRIKKLNLDLTSISDESLLATYQNAISSNTKVIVLTHCTHREGRILPIQQITSALKSSGVEFILDAAHSFAQFPYDLSELGIDYMATSLHKWLCAPHGTGLLYVKKEKIPTLFPLMAATKEQQNSMVKFEYLGTRAFYQEIGISAALDFYKKIGPERKERRLQHLKKYWIEAIKDLERVEMASQINNSCAIASFKIHKQKRLLQLLKKNYRIHAKSVGINNKGYIRICPNIFTLEKDLDVLIEAVREIAK